MYRNEDKTMVQILSDSSTLYSKSQATNIGLEITPLVVIIGKDNYREFETIDSDTLLSKIENGAIPTSSQPPIGEKMDLYNQYGKDQDVIDITMAAGLSGTYDSALMAKESCNYPDNISVFNSKTLCGPHRVLVNEALKMAKDGKTKEEILYMLEESAKTDVSFLIPFDFDFLQRGGRVSKTAAGLGGLLKLVVCMKKSDDGRCLEKHSVNRTLKKVVLSIFEEFDNRNVDDSYHISISHAFNEETASKVKKALVEKYPNATIEIFDLSPVFITQGGPKCCAIQAIKIVK